MADREGPDKPKSKQLRCMQYQDHCILDTCEVGDLPSFRCRDDDVWVCSFPRSGTTLTQQMTYLILTLDFEKGRTVPVDERSPFADCLEPAFPFYRGLKYIDSLPDTSPRLIKTHLPYRFLPDQLKAGEGKIIYITRNPKASVVSHYVIAVFMKMAPCPTLREYVEEFLDGKTVLGAPWDKHFKPYWEHRNDDNVLFLQFEKVVKDRRGTIEKIAQFIGKNLSKENVDKIYEETSLESMRNNDAVNFMYFKDNFQSDESQGGFINKGDDSKWRRELPEDLIQRMDKLIQETTKGTDVVFE